MQYSPTIEALKERDRVRLLEMEYVLYVDRRIRASFRHYDRIIYQHIAELTDKIDWKHKVKLKLDLDCHRMRVRIDGKIEFYVDFFLADGDCPDVKICGEMVSDLAEWIVMKAMG